MITKRVTWTIVLNEKNQELSVMEHTIGIPSDKVESHLLLIGMLENLKQNHLNLMRTMDSETIKERDAEKDC